MRRINEEKEGAEVGENERRKINTVKEGTEVAEKGKEK
jgi:hypothetical protein